TAAARAEGDMEVEAEHEGEETRILRVAAGAGFGELSGFHRAARGVRRRAYDYAIRPTGGISRRKYHEHDRNRRPRTRRTGRRRKKMLRPELLQQDGLRHR